MKVLLDQTGNAIYPLYWNFFANAVGRWEYTPISAAQASVRPVLGGAAGRRVDRSRVEPVEATSVVHASDLWVRLLGFRRRDVRASPPTWPAGCGGCRSLASSRFLMFSPARCSRWCCCGGRRGDSAGAPSLLGWAVLVLCVLARSWHGFPIGQVFGPTEANWHATLAASRQLGGWYNQPPYAGHALAVPSDRPDVTYGLARFGGVEGKHLVSEMYDPFYYLPSGYGYQDHAAGRQHPAPVLAGQDRHATDGDAAG